MSFVPVMQACADVVFRDVLRTTGVQLALTVWDNPAEGMGAVIHDANTRPMHPVWEAVGYLTVGDCLALHPPHRHHFSDRWQLPTPETDTTTDIAKVTQDLVAMLLWQHGLDATWPHCPEHPGRHPLQAGYLEQPRTVVPPSPSDGAETVSVWRCPVGRVAIVVGDLGHNQGPPNH
jgi:hypothetical protein